MRGYYKKIVKSLFCRYLKETRKTAKLTQSKMAEKLAMDVRSYIDLEHGRTCCSAITLALFLAYLCDDPAKCARELRDAFEQGGSGNENDDHVA